MILSDEEIDLLSHALKKEKAVVFAYLFGSQATHQAGKLSDTDIAIFFRPEVKSTNYFKRKISLLAILSKTLKSENIDLVILNEAPVTLNYQILRSGKLLFSKNEVSRIRFIMRTFSFYLDQAPLRNLQWEYLRKRIAHG